MSLCPEAEFRDGLSDAEFWDYVLNGRRPADGDDDYGPDPDHEALDPFAYAQPCPECGSRSACAFDIDGRPLIHATEKET
jgi:hypothetical protein